MSSEDVPTALLRLSLCRTPIYSASQNHVTRIILSSVTQTGFLGDFVLGIDNLALLEIASTEYPAVTSAQAY